jgi:hypothetical protein
VLTSHDAIACLGRAWFHHLLRRNALPGVQVIRFGVWRCARETFLTWLAEVANEVTLPSGRCCRRTRAQRRHSAHNSQGASSQCNNHK